MSINIKLAFALKKLFIAKSLYFIIMSCKDIVPLESPIKVPRWTSNNPSPARKLHKQQMAGERENFISSPPAEAVVVGSEMFTTSPSHSEMEKVGGVTGKEYVAYFSTDMFRTSPSHREMENVGGLKGKDHVDLRMGDDGVYVAWKDLWVSVPEKKKGGGGWRPILEGLTGYVEPGEVLAIMGPSGSGKSTLLDALAGRLGSNTRQTGDILINGRKQTLAFGTSAYVTQDDVLMTTLTVKEAVYYSAQLQLPDSMTKSEKKERAEATIREMGLQDAMNTRIGGWSEKGLSGGQKRRVSICLEILTRPKLLFLDEPTSGLDSATSYHVMNHIIKLTQRDQRTVIASIHQPSSEVFELFHNLCLLSSGRTVYFGSTSAASEFFRINGFPCPSMRNPSDHFLRTVNKDFDSDIEDGPTTTLKAINTLVQSYKSSEVFRQVEQRVSEICRRKGAKLERKGRHAGFITQCLVLTKRSFINMSRDLGYYWFRLAIYIGLGLCIGTLYYDIGHSYGSIQARGSMLMFIAGFLTFMAIGGFPSFLEDMKIFTRERLNGHYGVAAFVVGNTFSSIPYLVMVSVLPGATAYYLVGLQKGVDHFLYFCLLLFTSLMLVESLMMIVASIVPDFLTGIIIGAGIQGLMLLNAGFFRLPDDLPSPFWKYPMYYIAFHKYAIQGFYKNEFEGLSFPNENIRGPPTITGDVILKSVWEMESYSKWVDVSILFGMIILYRLLFLGIIKTIEKVKPMIQACVAKPLKHSKYGEINEQYRSQVLSLLDGKLESQKAEMEAEFLRRLASQREAQKVEIEAEFARRLNEEKEALWLEKEAAKLEMEAEFSRRLAAQRSEMEAFQSNLLQQIQASGVVLQIQ